MKGLFKLKRKMFYLTNVIFYGGLIMIGFVIGSLGADKIEFIKNIITKI